ncbi:TIGR00270 family protein [Candidatus Bathyarchaeota archaeon]|nr:TIGR00270 family protein [Candidatus Bathyarchaeota archaeon]
MLCEICGEKKTSARVNIDGLVFAACEDCTKFGNVLAERILVKEVKPVEESKEDIVPDYARRIRDAREKRGLSMEELANALMEKKTALAKVESGKMLPNEKLVKKLEKFLGISIRGVVDGVATKSQTKHPDVTLGDLAVVKKR